MLGFLLAMDEICRPDTLTSSATWPLAAMIFSMTEETPYLLVERRPPDLLAARNVALDLEMAVACALGGWTVARFPGDHDRA